MVYQLAALIIIPIILTIVAYNPFEEPIKVEPSEPVSEPQNDVQGIFIILALIWIFLLIRIIYQWRKGTFKIRTKF